MKLNAKQKAAVERWCYAELAGEGIPQERQAMNREDYIGDWKQVAPTPSPGPWKVKRTSEAAYPGSDRRVPLFVILDAMSRFVSECSNEVDAYYIAEMGPRK